MGLLSGSVSFSRFVPAVGTGAVAAEELEARIVRFAFRPLEGDSVQESALGWVPVFDPFRAELSASDWSYGDLLLLGLRVDRRVVPPKLLRHQAGLEERKLRAETGVDRLNAKMRKELTERVRQRLIRRALPAVETYDMVWDRRRGRVLFSSTTDRTCELFMRHFEATFGVRLRRLYAYAHFRRLAPGPAGLENASPARLD